MWVYPFILHYLNKYLGGSKSTPLVYPGVSPALEGEGGLLLFFQQMRMLGGFLGLAGHQHHEIMEATTKSRSICKNYPCEGGEVFGNMLECPIMGKGKEGQKGKGQRAKGKGQRHMWRGGEVKAFPKAII